MRPFWTRMRERLNHTVEILDQGVPVDALDRDHSIPQLHRDRSYNFEETLRKISLSCLLAGLKCIKYRQDCLPHAS